MKLKVGDIVVVQSKEYDEPKYELRVSHAPGKGEFADEDEWRGVPTDPDARFSGWYFKEDEVISVEGSKPIFTDPEFTWDTVVPTAAAALVLQAINLLNETEDRFHMGSEERQRVVDALAVLEEGFPTS